MAAQFRSRRFTAGVICRTPNAKCRTPNAERRTPNAERRTPNAERRTPNAERRTPNAERRTPNAERRTPNAERRTPNDCLSAVYLVKHVQSGTKLDLSTTMAAEQILISSRYKVLYYPIYPHFLQCQFLDCNHVNAFVCDVFTCTSRFIAETKTEWQILLTR